MFTHLGESLIGKFFQSLFLFIDNLLFLILILSIFIFGRVFFFHQILLSFLVQLADWLQVIVWSSESFNVDSHALEHFVFISTPIEVEYVSLVFLEEFGSGEDIVVGFWIFK